MSLQLDRDALNSRVSSGLDTEALQVLVENQPVEQIDETSIYCRWSIEPGAQKQTTLGHSRRGYIQLGIATLQIIAPAGTYMDDAYDVRQTFEDLFRSWRSTDGALKVYEVLNTVVTQNGYGQINCTIKWRSERNV
jgi:hypothetical protein